MPITSHDIFIYNSTIEYEPTAAANYDVFMYDSTITYEPAAMVQSR